MKKRFVVLLDASSDKQDELFLAWLKEKNVGWWHWLTNSWLISNNRGHLTASEIRDKARDIYGCNNFVIELQGTDDTWSGFGPNADKRNMFEWIRDNWSVK